MKQGAGGALIACIVGLVVSVAVVAGELQDAPPQDAVEWLIGVPVLAVVPALFGMGIWTVLKGE